MTLQSTVDIGLVLVLLLGLAMLGTARLGTYIRIFRAQSLVLGMLPIAAEVMRGEAPGRDAVIVLAGTLLLKVILIPWVLMRTIRTGEIQREIEPFIGFTTSMVLGAVLSAGCFAISTRLPVPAYIHPMSTLLVPVALSTLFIGLLIVITRTKAITQVLGYLTMENGIYLFGLLLLVPMPHLVELGILLDVFVGVFVMAIVIYHIRREFDHMDTHVLDQLKES